MAALGALLATAALAPAAAHAQSAPDAQGTGAKVPVLNWQPCDRNVPGVPAGVRFQCATATVPLDYSQPNKGTYQLALMKKPAVDTAKRLGSLFINYGGPGAGAIDETEDYFSNRVRHPLFTTLNQQYDIVAVDPRGTGRSQGALDCQANQITQGIYSLPFATPDTDPQALLSKDQNYVRQCVQLNRKVLPYVTSGNFARDLDLLRQSVGDRKFNYLGFSYGTFLGATYGALFPNNLGRVVLDGPVDADSYINRPTQDLQAQTSAFERELSRFFADCKADQTTCQGFGRGAGAGGEVDPEAAFDALVAQADANPIPVPAGNPNTDDLKPVTGDDILNATIGNLYRKEFWARYIVPDLVAAANGDGSGIRADSDAESGYDPDTNTFDPGDDSYFLIGAIEQNYKNNINRYFKLGKASYDDFNHFWFNNGYVELNYGIFPVEGNGVFSGPFTLPQSANTPLVVATTYDPATPYRGAKNLVHDMGNARLLTMVGDGHTAYGGESACIDGNVDNYLLGGTLPDVGTTCRQDVTFAPPAPAQSNALAPQAKATPAGRFRIGGAHQRTDD
jgi:pimeloyl-ACP methyl ester carboxylesterase